MLGMTPKQNAEFIYGQPMEPCPACGSYNMKPQMPIKLSAGSDLKSAKALLGEWARAQKPDGTPLEGPAYYMCFDCFHKAPAVDCTGRTSEACRADANLNSEMKRLWNGQGK